MSSVEHLLRRNLQRLQILHEIDRSILANRSIEEIARQALEGMGALIPNFSAGRVLIFNGERVEVAAAHVQTALSGGQTSPAGGGELSLEECTGYLNHTAAGQAVIVPDVTALPAGQAAPAWRLPGLRAYLAAPLHNSRQPIGLLELAAGAPAVFQPEHAQMAEEAADSLAVAVQESRLRQAEHRRRRQTEVMADMLIALAAANDLQGSLEVLLVHLHNLIQYDRAGLFLVDENRRYSPTGAEQRQAAPTVFPENDPLVAEMRMAAHPIIAADAQNDARFAQWPDLHDVRGWLGAPLLAEGEMLGFISLGALEPNAFSSDDVETISAFAEQAALVLARMLRGEQWQRRSEELEGLTTIASALGQAERDEDTLHAVVEQLTRFLGAAHGALLAPNVGGQSLVVQAGSGPYLLGLSLPRGEHWLWQVMESGQVSASEVGALRLPPRVEFYRLALAGAQSAAAIPLRSDQAVFAVMLFAFEARRKFTAQNLRLFQTVAEIASMALRRAMVLEGLERQVELRTQHLSTLYHINNLASQPGNELAVLEDVLYVAVAALQGSGGAVHFLDDSLTALGLAAQNGLAPEDLPALEQQPAGQAFWRMLLRSNEPVMVADLAAQPEAPEALKAVARRNRPAFLGASIRAKGRPLGVLSLFARTIQDYSIEDVTLFSTIADQIGGVIERARLVKQAELAAVVQERQRLARELHDSVTQLLYSQVLFSGAALKVLRNDQRPLAEQHLQRIEQAAQQALKEMRLLVYELRPSNELDEGLAQALERRLNAVEKRTGVNVRLVRENLPGLERPVAMALYRIAEEALNNILKHAQAGAVTVTLRGEPAALYLEISDDGRGFDPETAARQGGMGLSNIHERAAALGGRAEVISRPGEGARVVVTLPYVANRRSNDPQNH